MGPADGDITHYFTADWVYVLPSLKSVGNAFVRQAFGDWQVSGIFAAATGTPLIITEGASENTSRPDIMGPPVTNNCTHTLQYLNKAAFVPVPISQASGLPVRPGTLGRGAVRGPGYWNTDLSLGKNFRVTERVQFQIRMDAFNAFNHTNLSSFSGDVLNSSFGRFTNTRGARVAQLNARLSFQPMEAK